MSRTLTDVICCRLTALEGAMSTITPALRLVPKHRLVAPFIRLTTPEVLRGAGAMDRRLGISRSRCPGGSIDGVRATREPESRFGRDQAHRRSRLNRLALSSSSYAAPPASIHQPLHHLRLGGTSRAASSGRS